ncbi:MAG: NAD(P)-dependent oxidoreductase, partial [Rhodospirillales bacterium]
MKRLLITGAAGGLGTVLRGKLRGMADILRLADIVDPGPAGANEETVTCDLGDYDAVMQLVEGCDGIVHLGGRSVEDTFETILNANFRGTYHVYEAARKHGKPRIIFASSNHAIGFHSVQTKLDGTSPQRPDSIYGLSKC